MKDIINFLNIHYKSALKLVSDFDITKEKEWNPQIYLNELYVQLGHVYNVMFANKNIDESKRKIDNLGDELSDVLLQIINLAKIMNIDMYDIKSHNAYRYNNINGITILLGQLTEAIMEINDCRFKKSRDGFETSYDFVKDRLFKLFIITFNISKKYNLNIIEEFDYMLKDAHGFLNRFRKGNNKLNEYIDIYDCNENLLGYCEKNKAHKLGYWHRVFGCLIYNSKNNKVFLQLKNPAHNNINKTPLLEITAGGHLIAGETLKNGVREIKEETGLLVNYNDLKFLEKRKCNKTLSENYKIKEFQYFYSLDLNIAVNKFNNFDTLEVLNFIELDILELIKLINRKCKSIKGKDINNKVLKITINDLDQAFIQDGLYISLLTKLNIKKGDAKMQRELKKLYKENKRLKKTNPNNFYFDDGQVRLFKEYEKENIKYSVTLLNTDVNTNNCIVSLLIIYNNKSIQHLLKREFNNKRGTTKYFNELCAWVENNTNKEIIEKCYDDFFQNVHPKNSFLNHIFG